MTLGRGEVVGLLQGLQGGRGEQSSLHGPTRQSWDRLREIGSAKPAGGAFGRWGAPCCRSYASCKAVGPGCCRSRSDV